MYSCVGIFAHRGSIDEMFPNKEKENEKNYYDYLRYKQGNHVSPMLGVRY